MCLLAAGHAAGIAAADLLALPIEGALVGGLLGLGVGLAAGSARGRRAGAVVAAAAAGALVLAERLDAVARSRPPRPLESTVEARVASVERLPGGLRIDLSEAADTDGRRTLPPRLRLRLDAEELAAAEALGGTLPGERLRLRLRLRAPDGPLNPGGADPARRLAREGVGASARLAHPRLHVRVRAPGEGPPSAPLTRVRRALAARLEAAGPGGPLLATLALGERGGLSAPLREACARLGLAHLLSVSGLHLVLVAGGAYAGVRRILARSARLAARCDTRRLALLGALGVAALYTLLAGAEVPVQRSLVFVAAFAATVALGRSVHRGAALAGAALLVLALEPAALFAPGAQMSFAASAALLAMRRPELPPAARAGAARQGLRRSLDLLATNAAATAATAPLVALHLGAVQAAGLAANLVAVPWTGAVLMPASALGVLAAAAGEGPVANAALRLAERAAHASGEAALAAAAAVPVVAASSAPGPAWVVAALALTLPALRARRVAVRVAAAAAASALLAVAPSQAVAPTPPRVVFLDVGQGDAVLVQGERGALLVDAGPATPDGDDVGERVVLPALRALGVARLDLVAASHGDLDHRGGLPAVLRALPVGRVWLPHGGRADPAFAPLVATARAAGVPLEERGAGDAAWRGGDLEVEPLWPPLGEETGSRNDRSLTLRVSVGGRRLLLPGDLEAGAERRLLDAGVALDADVLKLAHHGSRTSSSARWLAAVGAGVGVASAPRFGRFGMPHAEVVERVHAAGADLWWTGRDGAVLVSLGPVLHVRGWRFPPLREAGPRPPER